jgi:hypothetical protein
VTNEKALEISLRLTLLPFFPKEAPARAAIAEELAVICETPEQAMWLTSRAVRSWSKWQSVRELRTLYASRFKPADEKPVETWKPEIADGPIALPEPATEPPPAKPKRQPQSEIVRLADDGPPPPDGVTPLRASDVLRQASALGITRLGSLPWEKPE